MSRDVRSKITTCDLIDGENVHEGRKVKMQCNDFTAVVVVVVVVHKSWFPGQ